MRALETMAPAPLPPEDAHARMDGWLSTDERMDTYRRVYAHAAMAVTDRLADGRPLVDWLDLKDELMDRIEAGRVTIPARVHRTVSARLVSKAARAVWAHYCLARDLEARESIARDASVRDLLEYEAATAARVAHEWAEVQAA